MAKKIENATNYINEIDSHKKSIFEFWKYSNKDEMSVLPEGEEEEVNVIKKIEKTFSYEDDMEEFGKNIDKIQRKIFNKEDTDSIFIATTDLLEYLNGVRTNRILMEELEENLKKQKKELKVAKSLDDEEYDIFGNLIEDSTKIKKINNKKHRELPKDKFNILDITGNTKIIAYKLTLQNIAHNIFIALNKGTIPESMPLYKATIQDKIYNNEINIFNINPENELKEAIKLKSNKIFLSKINIKEGTNGIAFSNIIFYDNQK